MENFSERRSFLGRNISDSRNFAYVADAFQSYVEEIPVRVIKNNVAAVGIDTPFQFTAVRFFSTFTPAVVGKIFNDVIICKISYDNVIVIWTVKIIRIEAISI